MPDVVIERRRDGAAVEAAVEHDDVGPAGGLPASRSAASMASLPELAKNIRSRPAGSTSPSRSTSVSSGRCMHGRVLAVDQRADLSLRGLDHARVAVTGTGHADPGGEVEISAAVLVVEVDALAAGGEDAGRLLQDLRELGHGHLLAVDG